jgi:rhomboid protease GluP
MLLLAFSGRTDALRSLLQTGLRGLQKDAKDFWIATSEAAAGDGAKSRALLTRLREKTADALIRQDIAQRLEGGYQRAPAPLTRASEETVDRFERNARQRRGSLLAPNSRRPTRAVGIFIALNVVMFLVEVAAGGATNPITLHRLGALEPWVVLAGHQYWRLFGSLFLHYGAIHLLFNAYALYALGPPLENAIGTVRFAICYLVAGLGSSLGVVLLWRLGWTRADFLVGASGCVMGIVGAWGGWLLRHRHSPMVRRRLTSLAFIVALQTAFDFYTPQVSMTAHLSGLITGLFLGLFIARNSPARRTGRP